MKYFLYFILSAAVLFFSCSDDEGISGDDVLHYDAENFTAPTLPSGSYEFAIRFPAVITRNVIDKNISEISFYLYELPDEVFVTISPDASSTAPGAILVAQKATNLKPNSWNTVRLESLYSIDGSAVWIGVQVIQSEAMQTVGCDAGPANANGDWLFDEADQKWLSFRERVGDSVNWNIRVKLRSR